MTVAYIQPQRKLFQHMGRLLEIKQGGKPAPINVEIDLSNRCSLGCEWCHFAFTHSRGPLAGKVAKPAGAIPGGDLMDADLAISIIDQLADFGVESITWTGGGEPTLHPEFDRIVEHGASRRVAMGLYTHGGHINEERAALLKRTLSWVYVSLDAATPQTYTRLKGVNRFDAAVKGIERLAQAEGDAVVGVGFLVTRENYHEIGGARFIAVSRGADYLQFRPTVLYDPADHARIAEDTGWLDEALPALERFELQEDVEVDLDRFRMYRDWADHGYQTCFWAALQSVITPNGKVWRCVNKREHGDALVGDLSVERFEDVWARSGPVAVDGGCRVMCRGHLPNLMLDAVMADVPHPEFV